MDLKSGKFINIRGENKKENGYIKGIKVSFTNRYMIVVFKNK
jgi:hypothetical protein